MKNDVIDKTAWIKDKECAFKYSHVVFKIPFPLNGIPIFTTLIKKDEEEEEEKN